MPIRRSYSNGLTTHEPTLVTPARDASIFIRTPLLTEASDALVILGGAALRGLCSG